MTDDENNAIENILEDLRGFTSKEASIILKEVIAVKSLVIE